VLVEIDPEPRRGLDEATYQIASDTSSPTTTVSSIETDEPEEEYDIGSPSNSFELVRLSVGLGVFQVLTQRVPAGWESP
jgi:hypothetical protein